jgi:cell division protein FtsB
MNPYEDEERRRRNGENLLRVTEEAPKADRRSRLRFPEFFKRLPIKNLVIGGLIICACFIGLALSERVSGMRADVARFKNQLKGQITGLEAKLAQTAKENEQLKNEITHMKSELESIKAENEKRLAQETARVAKKASAGKKRRR